MGTGTIDDLRRGRYISDEDYRKQKREIARQVVISQASGNVFLGLGCYRTIEDQKALEKRLKDFNFLED